MHKRDRSVAPLKHGEHGTRTGYKDGCRCDACRLDQLMYQRWYKTINGSRMREYQRWYRQHVRNDDGVGRVEVEPLMALVNLTRRQYGWLCAEIAEEAGVSEATVARVGRRAQRHVNQSTFDVVSAACRRLIDRSRSDADDGRAA